MPVETENVVPSAHGVAAVERDGPHRRVGEYEAQRTLVRSRELRHDRLEIVAVGAQAMQPDDAPGRIGTRLALDAFQQHGNLLDRARHYAWGAPAPPGYPPRLKRTVTTEGMARPGGSKR